MKLARSWKPEELESIEASSLETRRLRNIIANIDSNLENLPNSPVDARKLRELRDFFIRELRDRGAAG